MHDSWSIVSPSFFILARCFFSFRGGCYIFLSRSLSFCCAFSLHLRLLFFAIWWENILFGWEQNMSLIFPWLEFPSRVFPFLIKFFCLSTITLRHAGADDLFSPSWLRWRKFQTHKSLEKIHTNPKEQTRNEKLCLLDTRENCYLFFYDVVSSEALL